MVRPGVQADRFDFAGIRVPKYILRPSNDGADRQRAFFGHVSGVINLYRCYKSRLQRDLVQTR